MQVNHNQSLESPSPVTAPFASATAQSTSRRRLTALPSLEGLATNTTTCQAHIPDAHVAHVAFQTLMAELMMEAPRDATTTRKPVPGSRSLLAADGDGNATSVDLWFGYDVHYRAQPVQSNSGNFTPRYVGLRNQVLGGLYFQQVRN